MNSIFWWGLGIGAALSLLASILANLLMPAISKSLGSLSKNYSEMYSKKKEKDRLRAEFYIQNLANLITFIGINLANIIIGFGFTILFVSFLIQRIYNSVLINVIIAFFSILCLFIILRCFFKILDVRQAIVICIRSRNSEIVGEEIVGPLDHPNS